MSRSKWGMMGSFHVKTRAYEYTGNLHGFTDFLNNIRQARSRSSKCETNVIGKWRPKKMKISVK